jgi:hypothetical protein
MTSHGLGWILLAGTTLTLSGSACVRKQAAVEERPDTREPEALRESIGRQVGNATCSSPGACRAIPMGAKPCGGPRRYLIYSLELTDSARLAGDVARFNEAEARANKEKGMTSDCNLVLKPQVSCVSGRCLARRSGEPPPQ